MYVGDPDLRIEADNDQSGIAGESAARGCCAVNTPYQKRREYTINLDNAKKKLNDIVGVRVTCIFRDDIYALVDCLKIQHDIKILKIKDYIKTPKSSGYQGVHMILSVPIYLSKKTEWMKVELQLRTVAMDSWSVLDYQLLYKKDLVDTGEIVQELKRYSDVIADMDTNMMRLRDKIKEI